MNFQDVWTKAEEVSKDTFSQAVYYSIMESLIKLKDSDGQEAKDELGRILFNLCSITMNKNLNAWTALESEIDNNLAKLLDPDDSD